jgi:hypothetical protein
VPTSPAELPAVIASYVPQQFPTATFCCVVPWTPYHTSTDAPPLLSADVRFNATQNLFPPYCGTHVAGTLAQRLSDSVVTLVATTANESTSVASVPVAKECENAPLCDEAGPPEGKLCCKAAEVYPALNSATEDPRSEEFLLVCALIHSYFDCC